MNKTGPFNRKFDFSTPISRRGSNEHSTIETNASRGYAKSTLESSKIKEKRNNFNSLTVKNSAQYAKR